MATVNSTNIIRFPDRLERLERRFSKDRKKLKTQLPELSLLNVHFLDPMQMLDNRSDDTDWFTASSFDEE